MTASYQVEALTDQELEVVKDEVDRLCFALLQLREQYNYSIRQASVLARLKHSTVRSVDEGSQGGVTPLMLAKYGKIFGLRLAWVKDE